MGLKLRCLRASAKPVLENAALFVAFACFVEFFSHGGKCMRTAV
jgi:hypothetical protein